MARRAVEKRKVDHSKPRTPKKKKPAKPPADVSPPKRRAAVKRPPNTAKPTPMEAKVPQVSLKPMTKKEVFANEDSAKKARRINASYRQRVNAISKDISPIDFTTINWERRLKAKDDLEYFCRTYLPNVFKLGWSQDHLKCLEKARRVVAEGGMFCIAMPRGGGKTAICRGSLLWASAYGKRRFMNFIGSTDGKALQSLEFIKMYWYKNPLLQEDFPEVAYPIYKLDNTHHKARGQTYNGELTHVQWGSDEIRFPCLILPKEVAEWYGEHDPDSVLYYPELMGLDEQGIYTPKQAGIIMTTAGIGGSIRGDALVHPITLEQPRPDLVLLDDVQKDQSAESPMMCQKLINLIDGAVSGLAGPGEHINVLMPCTVIREGDAADTFLNPMLKPEYQGERCTMVISWPPGITDEEITTATEEGKLWLEYIEVYRSSMRQYGDFRLATEFYAKNREKMDNNFVCSWAQRYTTSGPEHMRELSAQQHAMNLRIKLGPMFLPEYQNKGRKLIEEGTIAITAEQLAVKVLDTGRCELPPATQHLAAFVDVQTEILFYCVLAVDPNFTGVVCDYGTWPEIGYNYFTKDQTRSWSLLTTEFFKAYPQHRATAIKDNSGHIRAPLEPKIYYALGKMISYLRSKTYTRLDEHRTPMQLDMIAIDTRWGETSDVVKRYIRESNIKELLPYYGQSIPPTHRQFEEYQFRDGWLFEHQRNPNVRDPKWCIKPNPDGLFHMMADVNRLKDFMMARLATPNGSPGCVSLYNAPKETHELFASHVCNAEYPEPTTARGITKNVWTKREGVAFDNDFLDCLVGCMAIASRLGASVKTTEDTPKPVTRKLSELYTNKRGRR